MQEYKTSWREKICFGVGAVGLDLSYGMFYSFLSYYLSSVLGLKEAFCFFSLLLQEYGTELTTL